MSAQLTSPAQAVQAALKTRSVTACLRASLSLSTRNLSALLQKRLGTCYMRRAAERVDNLEARAARTWRCSGIDKLSGSAR